MKFELNIKQHEMNLKSCFFSGCFFFWLHYVYPPPVYKVGGLGRGLEKGLKLKFRRFCEKT